MKTNKLFFTGCMVLCLTAGWMLGTLSENAFSQTPNVSETARFTPSLAMNGELLPTLVLPEVSIVAKQP